MFKVVMVRNESIIKNGFIFLLAILAITIFAGCDKEKNNKISPIGFIGEKSLLAPYDVALDSSGKYLFVIGDNKILKCNLEGIVLKKWHIDNKNKNINFFSGLAVANGNVIISDAINDCVYILNEELDLKSTFGKRGSHKGGFNNPIDVALGIKGEIFVVDLGNKRIEKFTKNLHFADFLHFNAKTDLITRIAVDAENNIYALSPRLSLVQKFSPSGDVLAKTGGIVGGKNELSNPCGMDVDEFGNIYVADTNNHRIIKFSSGGRYELEIGKQGKKIGQFNFPAGIKIYKNLMYVADEKNDRIQVLKLW